MAGAEVIDAPLVRVPFEALKRAAKERKTLIDEASEAISSLSTIACDTQSEQLHHLDQLMSRLQGIKRKLGDVSKAELDEAQRCKARLEHLKAIGSPGKNNAIAWNKGRLDRILVDHLLRSGESFEHPHPRLHSTKHGSICS